MFLQRFLAPAALAFSISAFLAKAKAGTEFNAPFAPSEGMVAGVEQPWRQELCLNGKWQFEPVQMPGHFQRGVTPPPVLSAPTPDGWEPTPIRIPSPWNSNRWGNGRTGEGTDRPYVADSVYFPSYPAAWDGVRMGWLRRSFRVPDSWTGGRLVLHFEAVSGAAQIVVNGKAVGEHFDKFLPFDVDVTDAVNRHEDNELLVGVRDSEFFDVQTPGHPAGLVVTYPAGSSIDRLIGIWNDVFLWNLPGVRVDDVFVQPQVDADKLVTEITVRNDTDQPLPVSVGGNVSPWVNLAGSDEMSAPIPNWRLDAAVLELPRQEVQVPAKGLAKVTVQISVQGRLKFWSPETPNLYGMVTDLRLGGEGVPSDKKYTRFGWRQFRISGRQLLLNGKPIQIWGDFIHPFGPFVTSRRYVWADYKMIKDFGGNSVRPHANPMPRHWANLADEMGICMLDESAIFGSSISLNLAEPASWERFDQHVDGLVLRDRNHPCIFGWSVANEMFALVTKVKPDEKTVEFDRLKALTQRPRAVDPTREWISVDGDEDLDGTLPVWAVHMGTGLPEEKKLPDSVDKPRMIGEHGGTYFAAPPRMSPINGDRSYESYAGRDEALGIDLYRMVTQFAKPKLTAFSASELVWFGLEQLPFGYRTDLRPPNRTDGVFFPPYVEGVPGFQIERLPPYVATLNPGFDPQLPLYKPMAMFAAMKAALDPRGPQPSPWDHLPVIPPPKPQPQPAAKIAGVDFVGDPKGDLYGNLERLGVPWTTGQNVGQSRLLIVDGETARDGATVKRLADTVWNRGGMVWVMIRDKGAALPELREILPATVSVTNRIATSLVHRASDPLTDSFALSDLYFLTKEGAGDEKIQKAGLQGPLVDSGKVLLAACNSDWTLFDRVGEIAKCGSMLIYEHLKKPAGAALVEVPRSEGKLWVSSLDTSPTTPPAEAFWTQLLRNVGVEMHKPAARWLVTAGLNSGSDWRYTTDAPAADWSRAEFDDVSWKTGPAGFGTKVPNAEPKTAWTSPEIYLRHAFDVREVPRALSLLIYYDDEAMVYLNGVEIFSNAYFTTSYKIVVLDEKARTALKPGRNVLAVRATNKTGGQFIDVGLSAGVLSAASKFEHNLLLDGPQN